MLIAPRTGETTVEDCRNNTLIFQRDITAYISRRALDNSSHYAMLIDAVRGCELWFESLLKLEGRVESGEIIAGSIHFSNIRNNKGILLGYALQEGRVFTPHS